jgi:hypothetical protein
MSCRLLRGGFVVSSFALVSVVVGAGCAGTAAQGSASVSASASLKLPQVGNPKYDRFFNDVVALQKEVAAVRAQVDAAPATLSAALGQTTPMALEPALDRVSAKLFGKVKVALRVTPDGAVVELVPVKKAHITDEDRAVMEAYRKVMLDLAQVPVRLRPVGERTAAVVKQAIGLAMSARQDFMGIGLVTTLPSVIRGIVRVKDAMASIKQDLPVILKQTGSTYMAMKKSMGLAPTVDFKLELPSVGTALAGAAGSLGGGRLNGAVGVVGAASAGASGELSAEVEGQAVAGKAAGKAAGRAAAGKALGKAARGKPAGAVRTGGRATRRLR